MEKDNRTLHGDERKDQNKVDISSIDSPVNTAPAHNNDTSRSLTNDEDAQTDPNHVADKPSFDRSEPRTGKFDGDIKI